jgi:DNA repair protein RecO (recombination protein O)
VLHTLPWRETSLIVEGFSLEHGRAALAAKGARRPMSALRGVLMAFQPLLMDWSGGGEVKTLIRAEWRGGQPLLTGRALMCGYYLNELMLRLTAREDPHPELFAAYEMAVTALARNESLPTVLRRFELTLLQELGYGIALERAEDGPVRTDGRYRYIIERGPVAVDLAADADELEVFGEDDLPISGQTLLDMAADDFSRAETLVQSKRLLRALINHYLGGQQLQSRRVLKELQEL